MVEKHLHLYKIQVEVRLCKYFIVVPAAQKYHTIQQGNWEVWGEEGKETVIRVKLTSTPMSR